MNDFCKQEELISDCEKISFKIVRNSAVAISYAIKAVNAGYNTEGYQAEIRAFGACFETDDFKEGTTAFIEKRKAQFTGK